MIAFRLQHVSTWYVSVRMRYCSTEKNIGYYDEYYKVCMKLCLSRGKILKFILIRRTSLPTLIHFFNISHEPEQRISKASRDKYIE